MAGRWCSDSALESNVVVSGVLVRMRRFHLFLITVVYTLHHFLLFRTYQEEIQTSILPISLLSFFAWLLTEFKSISKSS